MKNKTDTVKSKSWELDVFMAGGARIYMGGKLHQTLTMDNRAEDMFVFLKRVHATIDWFLENYPLRGELIVEPYTPKPYTNKYMLGGLDLSEEIE